MKKPIGKFIKPPSHFTKAQLIFVVEVMIASAMDAWEASRSFDNCPTKKQYKSIVCGIKEKLGFDLSILYAQLTGKGIGCCDVMTITNMEEIIDDFAGGKINKHSIASKFVDELFDVYFETE
jgi:hypothetical protein